MAGASTLTKVKSTNNKMVWVPPASPTECQSPVKFVPISIQIIKFIKMKTVEFMLRMKRIKIMEVGHEC